MAWDDDYGEAQQGDLSNDRRYSNSNSVVGKNDKLAQSYASKANELQKAANDLVRANGGKTTTHTDKLYAQAALNRDRALAMGYEMYQGQVVRRTGDRRTSSRGGDRRSYGVDETGGPPSSGPSRGNGKFF